MRRDVFLMLVLAGGIIAAYPLALLADDVEAQYMHASELLRKGDLKGAQGEFEAVLQARPNYRSAKVLLGLTLAKLSEQSGKDGDRVRAVAQLREALRLDPEEAYWHSSLDKLLHAQGNGEEAAKECAQAAKLSPDDSDLARGCGFAGSPEIEKDNTIPYWKDLASARDSTPPFPENLPDPAYSEKARVARLEGDVVLWLVVGVHGEVEQATVAKPLGLGLDESALRTVRTWKFKPATLHGVPIRARVMVEVSFSQF